MNGSLAAFVAFAFTTAPAAGPLPAPRPIPDAFIGRWAEQRPDGTVVNCLDGEGGIVAIARERMGLRARPIGIEVINGDPDHIRVRFVEREGRVDAFHDVILRVSPDRRQLTTIHVSFARRRSYVSCR